MSIEFYDVKLREKVTVPLDRVTKIIITQKSGQERYALRGLTEDGRKLTKFVSKSTWDALDVSASLLGKPGTSPPDDWSDEPGIGLPGKPGTPPPDDLPGEPGTPPPPGLSGKSGTFPSDG